ncbi:winged helix-turn-helix domain-containing protein [Allokutzneria sp. A3M-2-11 16]|uniref:ArsR/SmtB family transcription factor n=1 Tax=Allokutzneria sp. A3M-2-11 16 TaxID=2962043 RepID=UPI0020B72198|nr:winged helix-turn-helix domain-containing protein [Allokutzneria sp. A3M-2-11 16]MCP3801945.1 winged helix-turn-helix domain-containing protein [Allokutzneria sp. A3M-2-11 16]
MLRIYFTAEDLGRTRVAAAPDPLWETVLSVHRLLAREGDVVFDGWRHHVRSACAQPSLLDQLRLLLPLLPPRGYFPDFLTPTTGSQGLRAGIEAILSTPKQRLRAELELLDNRYQLPFWVSALAEGDRAVLRRLTSAIVTYHEVALAPYQSMMQACVDAERTVRARTLLDAGAEGLLSGLRPVMRWSYPVLEVEFPVDQELHLEGRGLLLLPSFFCYQYPVSLLDPTLMPVLVYPVERGAQWIVDTFRKADNDSERALAALLGNTRARVLEAIATAGHTTSELAQRVKISPASASQHATVLRNAGLVTSRRWGGAVLHTLTPLGASLLRNPPGHKAVAKPARAYGSR